VALSTCCWELQNNYQSAVGDVNPAASNEMPLMRALLSTNIFDVFGMIMFVFTLMHFFISFLISVNSQNLDVHHAYISGVYVADIVVSMLFMELCFDIWMWLIGFLNYYILMLPTSFCFVRIVFVTWDYDRMRNLYDSVKRFNIQEFRTWRYSPHVIWGACAFILMQVNIVDVFVSDFVFFYRECRRLLFGLVVDSCRSVFSFFVLNGMIVSLEGWAAEWLLNNYARLFNFCTPFKRQTACIIVSFISLCVAYFAAFVMNTNSCGYGFCSRGFLWIVRKAKSYSNAETILNVWTEVVVFPLVVLASMLTWHRLFLLENQHYGPPVEQAILCALYGWLIGQSLLREVMQLYVSMFLDDVGAFDVNLNRILNCGWIKDFWNWVDCLQIILGVSVVSLVWTQSRNALPVLAIAVFVRWWGTLFYLRVYVVFVSMISTQF
jgi:hypothetical protein